MHISGPGKIDPTNKRHWSDPNFYIHVIKPQFPKIRSIVSQSNLRKNPSILKTKNFLLKSDIDPKLGLTMFLTDSPTQQTINVN